MFFCWDKFKFHYEWGYILKDLTKDGFIVWFLCSFILAFLLIRDRKLNLRSLYTTIKFTTLICVVAYIPTTTLIQRFEYAKQSYQLGLEKKTLFEEQKNFTMFKFEIQEMNETLFETNQILKRKRNAVAYREKKLEKRLDAFENEKKSWYEENFPKVCNESWYMDRNIPPILLSTFS